MIAALQELWEQYPDQRLGQLVSNCVWIDRQIFLIEDDEMLERIRNPPWELPKESNEQPSPDSEGTDPK